MRSGNHGVRRSQSNRNVMIPECGVSNAPTSPPPTTSLIASNGTGSGSGSGSGSVANDTNESTLSSVANDTYVTNSSSVANDTNESNSSGVANDSNVSDPESGPTR